MPRLSKRRNSTKLPWQVLDLVSNHLDPKTLAKACCVSKTWFTCVSSDHIWQSNCTARFPSLSYNLNLVNPTLPYYRLYAMATSAAKRRSQLSPSKPSLSLHDLIFTVNVFSSDKKVLFSLEKPGDELVMDCNGVFKFDIDVEDKELEAVAASEESVRVTWNVVLKGWRGVFNMMESCQGKRGVFSEELPLPGCCSSLVDSTGVVAELSLVCSQGNKNVDHVARINKVSVGMFNTLKLRYVGVDDAFRYLQHFLC